MPASPIKMQISFLGKLISLSLFISRWQNFWHCRNRQTRHPGVSKIFVCSDIFVLLIICCFFLLSSPVSHVELLTCPRWFAELRSNNTWRQEINFLMFLLQLSFIAPYMCLIFSLTTLPPNIYIYSSISSHLREGCRSKEVSLSVCETLCQGQSAIKELRRNGCEVGNHPLAQVTVSGL